MINHNAYGLTTCNAKKETEFKINMFDSGGDGWEGNYLTFDKGRTKVTLQHGSNGTASVCLKDGSYSPYCCGGDYPSEATWEWVVEDPRIGAETSKTKLEGSCAVRCLAKFSGNVQSRVGEFPTPAPYARPGQHGLPTQQPTHVPTHDPTPLPTAQPAESWGKTPAPTSQPTHVPTRDPTPKPSSPTPVPTEDFHRFKYGLDDYVLYKYYAEMDPISCAKVNGSHYCWVQGNVGDRFRNNMYLGAYLFPIIQHFDADCYNCSATDPKKNPKDCNDVDLEVMLFFNPKAPSERHYVDTYNASFQQERMPYTVDNAGLDGAIYLNYYGGVKYLNELFYEIPDHHCAKPIKMASGPALKNPNACGSQYAKGLKFSAKGAVAKKAQKGFCQSTPLPPQETYFTCRYSKDVCVSGAIGEAGGQVTLVALVLGTILGFLSGPILGIPDPKAGGKKGKVKAKGLAQLILVKLLGVVPKKKRKKGKKGEAEIAEEEEEGPEPELFDADGDGKVDANDRIYLLEERMYDNIAYQINLSKRLAERDAEWAAKLDALAALVPGSAGKLAKAGGTPVSDASGETFASKPASPRPKGSRPPVGARNSRPKERYESGGQIEML